MSDELNDLHTRRRQALAKISSSIMTLTCLTEAEDDGPLMAACRTILEDLIRARYLLVMHEDPDGILDELASL